MAAERIKFWDRGDEVGNWDKLLPEYFPYILDMIFHRLLVQDLLSCSIVTKSWKRAARDILKRSRECYARIKYFRQDIVGLNEMIASTDIMEMINGLHIRNEASFPDNDLDASLPCLHEIRCSEVPFILQYNETGRKLEEAKQKVQAVLLGKWRHLNMDMGSPREQRVTLNDALLLREIISASCDSLQKLVIGQEENWKFIPCCDIQFIQLKVIQAEREYSQRFNMENSLSMFAPRLEEITGAMLELDVSNPVDSFLLERTKSIRVVTDVPVPEGKLSVFQFLSGLRRLDLQCKYLTGTSNEENDDRRLLKLNAFIIPSILRSLSTLVELRMDTLWFYELNKTSIDIQFPNLRLLSLTTHGNLTVEMEVSILEQLNLPKLCPNLEKVEILKEEAFDNVPVQEERLKLTDGIDQSDKPMLIDLEYRDGLYSHKYLTFFNAIYPKLAKVRILKLRNMDEYEMKKTFEDLNSLEYLEIDVLRPSCSIASRIDTLLCSIIIEEANMLVKKCRRQENELDPGIKPICPLLLNARSLKELKFTEDVPTHWERIHRNWCIEITENFPERHVRSLKVTFDASEKFFDRICLMRVMKRSRTKKRAKEL